MPESTREIAVPGSTSNLGPAFDALSVAVDLYLRIHVLDSAGRPGAAPEFAFEGRPVDGENRIATAFELAASRFGPPSLGLRVRVASDIPMAAGLGSSAAATVGGFRLYEAACGRALDTGEILAMATDLEGHPDNVAAALLGGITLSCGCEDGSILARSWDWPADIRLVVATPDVALPTKQARGVLPPSVPLHDAVANLQRALLFVRALETGDYGDIREALKDRWHQPARTPLVPGLRDALALRHPAVLGVCLSGAGPSVLALAAPGRADEAAALLGDIYCRLAVSHTIRTLAAHPAAHHPLPVPAA